MGWAITSAFARVYTSHVLQGIDPFLLCFYVFSLATIFFLAVQGRGMARFLVKLWSHRHEVWRFNCASFGAWFCVIYPLKYIEPALVSAIVLAFNPLCVLANGQKYYHQSMTRTDHVGGMLFGLLFLFMVFIAITGRSSVGLTPLLPTMISLCMCCLGSWALSHSNLLAKRLSHAGFTPSENIAARFFLLIVIAGSTAWWQRRSLWLSDGMALQLVNVSIVYAILPLYLIQVSIRALMPMSIAMGTPLMPVLVFGVEYASLRYHPSLWSLSAVVGVFVLSLIVTTFQAKYALRAAHHRPPVPAGTLAPP